MPSSDRPFLEPPSDPHVTLDTAAVDFLEGRTPPTSDHNAVPDETNPDGRTAEPTPEQVDAIGNLAARIGANIENCTRLEAVLGLTKAVLTVIEKPQLKEKLSGLHDLLSTLRERLECYLGIGENIVTKDDPVYKYEPKAKLGLNEDSSRLTPSDYKQYFSNLLHELLESLLQPYDESLRQFVFSLGLEETISKTRDEIRKVYLPLQSAIQTILDTPQE